MNDPTNCKLKSLISLQDVDYELSKPSKIVRLRDIKMRKGTRKRKKKNDGKMLKSEATA